MKAKGAAESWVESHRHIINCAVKAARSQRYRGERLDEVVALVIVSFLVEEAKKPGLSQRVEDGLARRKKHKAERVQMARSGEHPTEDQEVARFEASDDYQFHLHVINSTIDRSLTTTRTMTRVPLAVEPADPGLTPYGVAASCDDEEARRKDIVAAIMTLEPLDRLLYAVWRHLCVDRGQHQVEVARALNRRPQRVSEAIKRIRDRLAFVLGKYRPEYGPRRRGPSPAGEE